MINASPQEVRKFGITFAILTALIAGYAIYRESDLWMWFTGGSAFFLVTGLFIRPVLKPLFIGWMTFAHALAWFNTRLIMGVSFFVLFTPIGLVMRLFGKDFLNVRIEKESPSYWSRRTPETLELKRYEQLF
ncbi:MAG: hypothetical protein HOH43_13820 [Candidatus Latescibacteria bacterium]|jgi:hypothetical protein|nr:hypothetical protein [Candidatus Latescibacterota bacterium]